MNMRMEFLNVSLGDDEKIIRAGLKKHTQQNVTSETNQHNIVVRNDQGVMVAGLRANIMGESLHIKLLWVDDVLRGQSFGRQMMERAEQEAIAKGVKVSFVDTAAYQASEFYQKCGYKVVTTVTGYYDGYDRIFLKKDLA